MSLSIRRLIASIGRATLESQAMQVLRKYGASMWLFDPNNTYVESDGTGFTTEGSPIGFAQNLNPDLASLVDVQMPELISNGNFVEGGRGWTWQTGVTVGENRLDFATTGSLVSAQQTAAITNGKLYEITFTVASRSAGSVRVNCGRQGGTTGTFRNTTGTFTELLVAAGEFPDIVVQTDTGGFTGSVTGISVHEVLLGPELVVNGDFSAGVTGWGGASFSTSNGEGIVTSGVPSGTVSVSQGLTLRSGGRYLVTCGYRAGSAAAAGVNAQEQPHGNTVANITTVSKSNVDGSFLFTATKSQMWVGLRLPQANAVGETAFFDNISVREVLTPTVRLGPELVVDGGFSNGTANWSISGGATPIGVSSGGGVLNFAGSASFVNVGQNIGLLNGKKYKVSYTVANRTAGGVRVSQGGGWTGATRGAAGYYEEIFTATSNGALLIQSTVGDFVGSVTGVSVREVLPPTRYGPELVTNGDFSNGTNSWELRNGATLAVNGHQQASVTFGALAASRIEQVAQGLTPGKTYELSVEGVATFAGATVNVTFAQSPWSGIASATLATGANTIRFVAPPQGAVVRIERLAATAGGETCTVDNISLREVIDIPLTQPTSAAKPILRRVPVKFGPELVVNGDFSNGANGWNLSSHPDWAISGGVLNKTGTTNGGGPGQASASPLVAARSYLVSYEIKSISGGLITLQLNGGVPANGVYRSSVGVYTEVIVAREGNNFVRVIANTASVTGTVDNISVREITDWAWAADFDGLNDFLITNTLPAAAEETLIVAGQYTKESATNWQYLASKRNGLGGLQIRKMGSVGMFIAANGVGPEQYNFLPDQLRPSVFTGVAQTNSSQARFNGSKSSADTPRAYSSVIAPLTIGGNSGGLEFLTGPIFGIVYAGVGIPDDELRILERYLALRCKQEIL